MYLFLQLSKTFFHTDTKIFLSIVGIVLILLSNCMPISAETGGLIKDVRDLQANYETINEKLNLLIKLNTWEKFTNNITDLVKNNAHHHYDYAVFRNGGFRELKVSTWNGGWRAMTEPYMTGDCSKKNENASRVYLVGGSMWVWGNWRDPNTNNDKNIKCTESHNVINCLSSSPTAYLNPTNDWHVFHYYYYYGDTGAIAPHGNKWTKAHKGGEGYFYRKLRGMPESPEVNRIIEEIGGEQ